MISDNCFHNSASESGETRTDVAVKLISTAVYSCKVGYSALGVSSIHHQFNVIIGLVASMAVMSLVTKVIVVFIYLFVGAKTEGSQGASQDPISTRL